MKWAEQNIGIKLAGKRYAYFLHKNRFAITLVQLAHCGTPTNIHELRLRLSLQIHYDWAQNKGATQRSNFKPHGTTASNAQEGTKIASCSPVSIHAMKLKPSHFASRTLPIIELLLQIAYTPQAFVGTYDEPISHEPRVTDIQDLWKSPKSLKKSIEITVAKVDC